MRRRPMNASEFPGSCTGNLEYPLKRLYISTCVSRFCHQTKSKHKKANIASTALWSKIVSALRISVSWQGLNYQWNGPKYKTTRTLRGVMIVPTFLVLSSKTPFKIEISSSRRGSWPVRWNCRKDFNSAFLYVWCSLVPRTRSRSFAIGQAMGARNSVRFISSFTLRNHSCDKFCKPKMYIIPKTKGAQVAPIASPYRTLTACGMILNNWKKMLHSSEEKGNHLLPVRQDIHPVSNFRTWEKEVPTQK